MIPHRTPFFLPLLYPTLCWRIPTSAKELFLTFDDGPVPGPTEFVLKTLNDYSLKATFFCIGDNVFKHPDVFAQVVAQGHAVGNHTFHHVNGWKFNRDQYFAEVLQCEAMFEKNKVNRTSKLFRPPYGRIRRSQIESLHDFKIVMWDVLSVDYNRNLSKEACLHNTIKVVRPGSVIVFHDSLKAERNLTYALPRFIESCLSNNYTFGLIPA